MRRKLGYFIALAALLISIPRYIATFAGIDTVELTAYGMGFLLAGGAAYIVDAWADANKRNIQRTWPLLVALGINLAYEPILLTPFVLSRLWSQPLAVVMSTPYAVFWSIMVTLAPVLLVFGVVYAVWFHKIPTTRLDSQRKKNEPATKPEQASPFYCSFCDTSWPTQRALAGHMNKHRSDNGREKESIPKETERVP